MKSANLITQIQKHLNKFNLEQFKLSHIKEYYRLNSWLENNIPKNNKWFFIYIHYYLNGNSYENIMTDKEKNQLKEISFKFNMDSFKGFNITFYDLICSLMFPNVMDAFNLDKDEGKKGLEDWLNINKSLYFFDENKNFNNSINSNKKKKYISDNTVVVIGFFKHKGGIGEDARLLSQALEVQDINVYKIDISEVDLIKEIDSANILFTIGPASEIYKLKFICNDIFAKFNYIISFIPWELPDWPQELSFCLDHIDEILVSSEFTKKSFSPFCKTTKINMPFDFSFIDDIKIKKEKQIFKIIFVFDAYSYLGRKNPFAVVETFKKAFQYEKNVKLILKVSNMRFNKEVEDSILNLVENDERIILIEEQLSKYALMELIGNCNCMLALQRSEGFGRLLLESLSIGTDVISTDFSGCAEYASYEKFHKIKYNLVSVKDDYPFSKNQYWAEPDIDDASCQLRKIYSSWGNNAYTKSEVNQSIVSYYSIDECSKQIKKIINL